MTRTHITTDVRRSLAIALAVVFAANGLSGQTSIAEDRAAAPGKMVDVGGRAQYLDCRGSGQPTVVVDPGAGSWSVHWWDIQDRLAGTTRVCTYDRAGLGLSDAVAGPRTSERMAAELATLLSKGGEPGPYLLVGHSLGGYNVRVFAHRYPERVAGVVLVDAAHEQQFDRLPPIVRTLVQGMGAQMRGVAAAIQAGKVDPARLPTEPYPGAGASAKRFFRSAMSRPSQYLAHAAEGEGADSSAAETARAGSLGDLPLVVVTAGNSFGHFVGTPIPIDSSNVVWRQLQRELGRLSTKSWTYESPTGTHTLNAGDPDLVVRAIDGAIREIRNPKAGDTGLPSSSTPEIDKLLHDVEVAYASKDGPRFVNLFSDDVVQWDVLRRVRIQGKAAWLRQTESVNAAHHEMGRTHLGRAVLGDRVIAEIEWWGTVRGTAIGGELDRSYRYRGLGVLTIKDGKIASQVLYGDVKTLEEQLGLHLGTQGSQRAR